MNIDKTTAILELQQQDVIEVFYILNGMDCVDTWAVAYDEHGLLDDHGILTDIHYEMKTIWVSKRLRKQKQKRDQEVETALKFACEYCGHGSLTAQSKQGETLEKHEAIQEKYLVCAEIGSAKSQIEEMLEIIELLDGLPKIKGDIETDNEADLEAEGRIETYCDVVRQFCWLSKLITCGEAMEFLDQINHIRQWIKNHLN